MNIGINQMSGNMLAANFNDVLDNNGNVISRPAGKTPVSLGYLICITPRSGSTFLTHLLRDNRYYGYPNEWFNFESISKIITKNNLYRFNDYIEFLWREYSSQEGIFGVQLSYPQYSYLDEIIPLEGILGNDFKWFILSRKNIVLQAISLFIAIRTGVFHRYCFDGDLDTRNLMEIDYDEKQITKHIVDIVRHEQSFERLFVERGVLPVRYYYEDMVENKVGTIQQFSRSLGVNAEVVVNDTHAVKRLSNKINYEFEERYRACNGNYLEELFLSRNLPV